MPSYQEEILSAIVSVSSAELQKVSLGYVTALTVLQL